jgi:ElaA protein
VQPAAPDEHALCMEIRRAVFVEEQGFPLAEEADAHEAESRFVLAKAGGSPVGCLRFRAAGRIVKVERVATLARYRHQGVGRAVMACMEREAAAAFPGRPYFLHSQLGAVSFYERLGYTSLGALFDDTGAPHRAMIKLVLTDGPPMVVERLTAGSLPEAAETLVRDVLSEHGLEAMLPEALGPVAPGGALFVLRCGARVVGTGELAPLAPPLAGVAAPIAKLGRMFLAPAVRALSLGRQLLTLLELEALYGSFRTAYVESPAALREALALYEHGGYRRLEEAPGSAGAVRLARALPLTYAGI